MWSKRGLLGIEWVEDGVKGLISGHRDSPVQELHGGEAHKLGVGGEAGGVDDGVQVDVVQGEHQPDAVEAEPGNLAGDGVDGLAVQAVHHQVLHVGAVPGTGGYQ